MKQKVILVIGIILFALSLIVLIRAEDVKSEINKSGKDFTYTESYSGVVTLKAAGGEDIYMQFGERSVKIEKSYLNKDSATQTHVIRFIFYFAKAKGIVIQRQFTDMLGELRLHNFLYRIGYKSENTADADLDYDGDDRWYVNIISKLF